MEDKKKKLEKSKGLLKKLMTFGARDKAKEAPKEKYLDKEKMKRFKFKR